MDSSSSEADSSSSGGGVIESSSSEAQSSESTSSTSNSSDSSSSDSSSSEASSVSAGVCPGTGLYFCDDFANGTADNWDLLPTTENTLVPDGTFKVEDDNGNYVLQYTAASKGGVLALVKPTSFAGVTSADYYVEAKIRPRANGTTGNKQLYILARYQDGNNWYAGALNVQNATTSTQVEIAKMAAGSLSRPKQVKKPISQGTLGMLDGVWYSLRLELLGDQLTVYLDGENLGSITDSSFTTTGLIGLWTSNKSFEIDDIKVGNANDKPASLLISPSATSYAAEVGDAAKVISVAAKTDAGDTDTFTAVSSNTAAVAVSVSGTDVSLTPVGEGVATITFTSSSGLVRTVDATIAPQFVMPTATYTFTNQLVPAAGETDAYEDLTLKLTFDSAPTLGTAGSIRVFKTSDDTMVDKIALNDESDSIGFGTLRTIKTRPVRISGNTASISLHANKLEAGTSYYVAVSDSVFTGANLAGQAFAGIGKNSGWSFTTRAAGPDSAKTSLVVDDNGTTADFRSVQGALNFVMKNATANATITVKDGVYEEPLYLRNTSNLTIQGESREGTVIQYPNNELLNSGSTGRAVFLVEGGDMLTLDNLTLKNTTLIGAGGQAETIYFNSTDGRLVATNANFISEQDTLLLKGWTWFYNSLVAGNVDFIWGYSKASLFEQSEIRSLGRSSGNANGGYVLQARVENQNDKGFVFLNSSLTGGAGPTSELPIDGSFYLARSPGGTTTWDNVVFVNTKMGSHINTIGWAGGGISNQPVSNPATGTATTGWREYNSMDLSGNALDMSARQFGYQMNLGEVQNSYCSRAQIFAAFGGGAGWDPMPSDTSDCISPVGSSSSAASSVGSSSSSDASSSAASSDASAVSSTASDSSSSASTSSAAAGSSDSSSSASSAAATWVGAATQLGGTTTGISGSLDSASDSAITFTANGGKFESTKTSMYTVTKNVTGDFTLTAKVKAVGTLRESSTYQFPTGLILCVCDTASATSSQLANVSINDITADTTVNLVATYGHILTAGGSWNKTGNTAVTPGDSLYLKLVRAGQSYTAWVSTDGGANYTGLGNNTFTGLPDTVKVGFFAAPNGSGDQVFTYEDIQLTQ